jgi:hypothetical protein
MALIGWILATDWLRYFHLMAASRFDLRDAWKISFESPYALWWCWREQYGLEVHDRDLAIPDSIAARWRTWTPNTLAPLDDETRAWLQGTVLALQDEADTRGLDHWIRRRFVGPGSAAEILADTLSLARRLRTDGVDGLELFVMRMAAQVTPRIIDEWLNVYAAPASEPVRHRHCVGDYSFELLKDGRYAISEWQRLPSTLIPEHFLDELTALPVNPVLHGPAATRGLEAAARWDSDRPLELQPTRCTPALAQWLRTTLWYPSDGARSPSRRIAEPPLHPSCSRNLVSRSIRAAVTAGLDDLDTPVGLTWDWLERPDACKAKRRARRRARAPRSRRR